MRFFRPLLLLPALLIGCAKEGPPPARPDVINDLGHSVPKIPEQADPVLITVLGTNDLHGAIDRLPILAGYVANVRAARARDGGGMILVDAGDMFQGTLESNLNEGSAVIEAYNLIGYTAATAGNHEFDFGPVGPATTPSSPADDARGALKQRAQESKFPILVGNIADEATGARVSWPRMPASTTVVVAGQKIGIIGVTTESTPTTTTPMNFVGLDMIPLASAITGEAKALRQAGAKIVVVTAHAGARCKDLDDPEDTSSCEKEHEIFRVAEALPPGLVDVIVAGHVHAAMAHRVNGIPIIESYASGRAFGRVDLHVDASGRIFDTQIHQPKDLCPLGADGKRAAAAECQPGDYEGAPVVADAAVKAIADRAVATAVEQRHQKLGVTLAEPFRRGYAEESVVGNMLADLMLKARPDAEIAMTNGGGIRADLPAGPLEYGSLYETMPFDNRFAIVKLKGADVRAVIARNLRSSTGIFSWSGLSMSATCTAGELTIVLRDRKGKVIKDDRALTLATSDFLASGGDGAFEDVTFPEGSVEWTTVIVREALADVLRRSTKTELRVASFYDPKKPRLVFPGKRPVTCK